MPIQILPAEISERIAAGEVVERPASVVKELVENAIDAGATEIAVILKDGGKSSIEVLDNGSGMPPSDMSLSIQRHATSKLQTIADLENILTLGFRGEALPSIAAASQLRIVSQTNDSKQAYEISVDDLVTSKPQKIAFGNFLGALHGTSVKAESLFSQIPARLKFLKSARSEVTAVKDWIEKLSLTKPEIGFRLSSNDKILLDYRPGDLETRIRTVLADGQDFPIESKEFESSEPEIQVKAYWLKGMSLPSTKKLAQVVNGRILKDRILQQAILSSFRQTLLPGQFPAVLLKMDLHPSLIDVNVHPTKTEVRFLNQNYIFKKIQTTFDELIRQEGMAGYVGSSLLQKTSSAPTFSDFRAKIHGVQTSFSYELKEPASQPLDETHGEAPNFDFNQEAPRSEDPSSFTEETLSSSETPSAAPPVTDARITMRSQFSEYNYIGPAFQTYLLYDLGNELGLIDQHAAHERIRFEILKKAVMDPNRMPEQQALLLPETIHIKTEDKDELLARIPIFEKLGFELDLFGEDKALFRATPSVWGQMNLKTRLKNLVEKVLSVELDETNSDLIDETLFEKLASEACHSAVRAGDRLDKEEAISLVRELFDCEHPWNCPHGRPTIVKVSKYRLEEWFQRKI